MEVVEPSPLAIASRRVLRIASSFVGSPDAVLSVFIINLSLLCVRQHEISLTNLFKFSFCLVLVVGILIRVPFERQLSIRLLDLDFVCAPGEAQNLVVLTINVAFRIHHHCRAVQFAYARCSIWLNVFNKLVRRRRNHTTHLDLVSIDLCMCVLA